VTLGLRIEVRGAVQGVGFRPWVYRTARELGISGRVFNHARGVTIEAFGERESLEELTLRLGSRAPGSAAVRDLATTVIPARDSGEFVIASSATEGERELSLPPDFATCPDCLAEIFDPRDRHFGYAFTSCTACGPRYTIATGVPYDRPVTTMAPFAMCEACRREYEDPFDRRFHAQTNACPACGPELEIKDVVGRPLASSADALCKAVELLEAGAIVAVKGLGGFHLACDATRSDVVRTLRARKHRDEKPFAVMVSSLEAAREHAAMTTEEEALLVAHERPIVLVSARHETSIAPEVAPESRVIGLLLPYTPLHHLLLGAVRRPLVMTSANPSDEPICQEDGEARERLADIADAILTHDRVIAARCDDSVARVIAGKPSVMRRSRAYVPRPIALRRPVANPVLACGGHLKNTFCLVERDSAYLGPHIGDLESLATLEYFEEAVGRFERFLGIRPEVIAHDLHPGYASTSYALARPELQKIGVQHHHAHVASAMAEHGLEGRVLGVAYDGTGFGTDGTSWGGELLFAGFDGFERWATFRPLPLAGGDRAVREVWRIALALVLDAFGADASLEGLALFREIDERRVRVVRQMLAQALNSPLARGAGRYFDAIGALVLGRAISGHEGQVAVALNQAAAPAEHGRYPFVLHDGLPRELDLRPMVRAAVAELREGRPAEVISARFHNTLIAATSAMVRDAARELGRLPVVLTGGVFQNPWLAEGVLRELSGDFDVFLHEQIPCGDGGIALGQALVADAIVRGRS
jgi:hydrogenase maturation protein HypF